MNAPDECPRCGGITFHRRWATGRKFVWRCDDDREEGCYWESKAFLPPKQKIEKTKHYTSPFQSYWRYEIFDSRGHSAVSSRGYPDEKACIEAATEDLARYKSYKEYGKCTAVIWPPYVIVKGKVIK